MDDEPPDPEIPETYLVEIVRRDGMGQTSDDFHATVTRLPDQTILIFISRWRWVLGWRTRSKALHRAFKYHDKRMKKLTKTERFTYGE